MRRRNMRGFTFLEIMVVVAILAILAGLIIPRFVGRAEEARRTKAIVQMREIMKALELYKLDNGNYPTTEQGLIALVEQPTSEPLPKKWRQYVDKVPVDPWKNNFIYVCPGADHGRKNDPNREKVEGKYGYYDLMCYGQDGVEGEDDIVSWNMPEE
ncbi:MAG: type II secretion system major pseudopilin GspG [Candidatus Eremiobacteraeota bacterium]|nr:type II secretion system major pseudopilin GspG [Candidatus Eremiobacteraeota bacterium]